MHASALHRLHCSECAIYRPLQAVLYTNSSAAVQTSQQSSGLATTDQDGFATLAIPNSPQQSSSQLVGQVTAPSGQALFVDMSNVYIQTDSAGPSENLQGTLILDRAVVGPGASLASLRAASLCVNAAPWCMSSYFKRWALSGDCNLTSDGGPAGHELHVSGFIREVSDAAQVVAAQARLSFCGRECFETTVPVDATFGFFNYTQLINPAAIELFGYGGVQIRLEACTDSCTDSARGPFSTLAVATVTVSDPRPPTAELTLDAPRWAKPGSSVPVSGVAESFLGADVADANISVVWNVQSSLGGEAASGAPECPVTL